MSETVYVNKFAATELRAAADYFAAGDDEGYPCWHHADAVAKYLRERANEMDPPPPELPTAPAWYPEVHAKDSGYLPGAMRTGADPWHWLVLKENGIVTSFEDSQVKVVSSPRVFVMRDPIPEVGTKLVGRHGPQWNVESGEYVRSLTTGGWGMGVRCEWYEAVRKYGPFTEVL